MSYESIRAGIAALRARERDYVALEQRVLSQLEGDNIRLDDEYRRQLITGRRSDWVIMDEISAFPERPRDDYLDAMRYAFTHTYQASIISPSLTAMLPPMEVGRIDGTQTIEAPKEEKMNEFMTALEAMIARIVQAELAKVPAPEPLNFDKAFEKFVADNTPKFAAIVSQGALDQPWFDDAIKAEVVEAVASVVGHTFADKAAFEVAVSDVVRNRNDVANWVHDKAVDAVSDMSFTTRVA